MDVQPVDTLNRSKTMINVPANARERIMASSPLAPPNETDSPAAVTLSRSNTNINSGRRLSPASLPTRGLSIRKPGYEDIPPQPRK